MIGFEHEREVRPAHRQRSGSTPHDPITADQQHCQTYFAGAPPAIAKPAFIAEFADRCTRKHPAQATARSFAPICSH